MKIKNNIKKNQVVLIILLLGILTLGISQTSSKSTVKEKQFISVAAKKMNIFYRGVDNPISICVEGVPNSELSYTIEGDGEIAETDSGLVVRHLRSKKIQQVSISVFVGEGNTKEKVGEHYFRVKDLPSPNVYVAYMDREKEIISRAALLANPFLLCGLPEFVNFDYPYKVLGFIMGYPDGDGGFITLESNTNELTDEMKEVVKLKPGNLLCFFSDVVVQGPRSKRVFPGFVLKIK